MELSTPNQFMPEEPNETSVIPQRDIELVLFYKI